MHTIGTEVVYVDGKYFIAHVTRRPQQPARVRSIVSPSFPTRAAAMRSLGVAEALLPPGDEDSSQPTPLESPAPARQKG